MSDLEFGCLTESERRTWTEIAGKVGRSADGQPDFDVLTYD